MVVTAAYGWLPLDNWWYKYLAMTPDLVIHRHWYYQLVTSVFLHDGSQFLHLASNMYLLWVFGPRVERTFGSKQFLLFYLATGVAGSILSLIMRSITGAGEVPSLGASSAVFGMLTAYGFLFANEILLLFFVVPMRAWKVVVLFIVLETLFVMFNMMPQVDHYAHLGGAVAAAIWMLVLIRVRGNRTSHGWFQSGGNPYISSNSPKASSLKGFRVIVGRPKKPNGHPEGTDNEPPPDWWHE
jgi:membrane associated rhomboid family serine protease